MLAFLRIHPLTLFLSKTSRDACLIFSKQWLAFDPIIYIIDLSDQLYIFTSAVISGIPLRLSKKK